MKKTYDHLGNEYRSTSEMCRFYGITHQAFFVRMKAGWTLERALTENASVTDHKGNKYKSIRAMCQAYNINKETFYKYRAGKPPVSCASADESDKRTVNYIKKNTGKPVFFS